jgi:hypothetical protein
MMAIPALLQGGIGIAQGIKGFSDASNLDRPEYDIPESAEEALGTQRAWASQTRMPGQTIAEENIRQNQADVMAAMRDMGGSPAGLSSLNEGTSEALESLGARSSMWQTQQKDMLLRQLGQMAGYEDKKWNWDERMRFEENAAEASALIGSGMQNVMGAAKTGADYAGAMDYRKWLEGVYGIGGEEGGTSGMGSSGLLGNETFRNTVLNQSLGTNFQIQPQGRDWMDQYIQGLY